MGIISWIILGLITGLLAKAIMGRDRAGLVVTILLGIAGAVVGGFLGTRLGLGAVSGFNVRSLLIAMGGAVLLLAIHGMIKRGRAH